MNCWESCDSDPMGVDSGGGGNDGVDNKLMGGEDSIFFFLNSCRLEL